MIAKLRGIVDSVEAASAIIDCGGVGYLVQASGRTLGGLTPGAPASLLVITEVREDAFILFAFESREERDMFTLLTTVQGVGGRVALNLLSVLRPAELAQAIVLGDKAALARADGVGPKLALRLATELKDKAAAFALPVAGLATSAAGKGRKAAAAPSAPPLAQAERAVADAVSALVNLGYGPSEAFAAAASAAKALGEGASLAAIIPQALKALSPLTAGDER